MSVRPVRALVLGVWLLVAVAIAACGPAGEPSLARSAWPVTLAGSSWTAIRVGDQATVAGSEPTATFAVDKLEGTGGCNHYFGSYEYARGAIKITNMGSTAMACLAAGIGETEQKFLNAMQGASSVSIDPEGRMILDGSGGSITFTVAPQQTG
jgi:heat shock protein HslJ